MTTPVQTRCEHTESRATADGDSDTKASSVLDCSLVVLCRVGNFLVCWDVSQGTHWCTPMYLESLGTHVSLMFTMFRLLQCIPCRVFLLLNCDDDVQKIEEILGMAHSVLLSRIPCRLISSSQSQRKTLLSFITFLFSLNHSR